MLWDKGMAFEVEGGDSGGLWFGTMITERRSAYRC